MPRKALLILLLLACISNHTATTRSIGRIGKSLSIGLPFFLTARDVLIFLREPIPACPDLTEPSPKIVAWVQRQAEICNVSNVHAKIADYTVMPKSPFVASTPNTIIIRSDWANSLDKGLADLSDDKIAAAHVILSHELGHLYHKDPLYYENKYKILPMISGAIAVQLLSNILCKSKKTATAPLTFLSKSLIYGVGKYTLGKEAGCALEDYYKRYTEIRADKFACRHASSPEMLRKTAHVCEENAKSIDKTRDISTSGQKIYMRLINFLHPPHHPHFLDRAKMFREAADKLEKQHIDS